MDNKFPASVSLLALCCPTDQEPSSNSSICFTGDLTLLEFFPAPSLKEGACFPDCPELAVGWQDHTCPIPGDFPPPTSLPTSTAMAPVSLTLELVSLLSLLFPSSFSGLEGVVQELEK